MLQANSGDTANQDKRQIHCLTMVEKSLIIR